MARLQLAAGTQVAVPGRGLGLVGGSSNGTGCQVALRLSPGTVQGVTVLLAVE